MLFINAINNSVIAKKKARVNEGAKERFKKKAREEEHALVARWCNRTRDIDQVEEIVLDMELDQEQSEQAT
jgi:hypothetical protein